MNRVLILFALFLVSCTKGEVQGPDTQPGTLPDKGSPSLSFNVNKNEALQRVNAVRAAGCNCGATWMPPVAPVTWNDQVAKVAYEHSYDMKRNRFFQSYGQ